MEDKEVLKSYVWHGAKCYFVSTINRDYDTYIGTTRGQETLVWEYDWDKRERGDRPVFQGGGIHDHIAICRSIIAEGEFPNPENPKTERFCKGTSYED